MTRIGCMLLAVLLLAGSGAQAQEADANVVHARAVLQQLRDQKFGEVVGQFNARMAAALTEERLADVWKTLGLQVGAFQSEIDQQTRNQGGATVVILGSKFERAELNVVVAFDPDNKIAGLSFQPRPPSTPPPPPPAGVREEAFTVGADGLWPLPGTLSLPADAAKPAVVVLVHGSGANDQNETIGPNAPFRDLAWGLASKGIAVLRYEKRTKAHGPRLAASVPNFTIREETVDDALAAVRALERDTRVDSRRVVVLGHSLGGMAAPMIGQEDRSIAGLVILAGNARPAAEIVLEQAEYLASISKDPAALDAFASLEKQANEMIERTKKGEPLPPDFLGATAAYWQFLNNYNPAKTAASLDVPMLILQGERDYQVSMKDFEVWRTALAGRPNVTLKSYPDLNHLFMTGTGKSTPAEYEQAGHVSQSVIDDIAAWVSALSPR